VHAKVYISAKKDAHIGLANSDSESLTQVCPTKKTVAFAAYC
jgi:hypothetical protein